VRLDAKYAKWNGKNWISGQGVKRRFNSSGEIVSAYQFKEEILPLTKSPDDILEIIFFEKKEPEEISFFSLLRYITILRKCGSKVTNYLVEFHMKVSFPMINFMMVLIGAPLALFTTLKGRSIAEFGISIFIGFIYWGTMAIGRSLGRSEMLSPFLSAWLANLIFGFLGIYLLVKVKK
ncbi:LptF/LptG family permease, partial [bacterium]|nr:LptF/LptG family permease [bacterium]